MKKNIFPPFFSIITPVFNGQKYLNRFFAALQYQSFPYWEVIIVNDNSVDDTHSFLSKYSCKDSRVKYFECYPDAYVKHGMKGPYAPRNFAIDQAKGEYLCFLDIDDYWLPDKLMRDFMAIDNEKSRTLLYSNCFLLFGPNKCFLRRELTCLPPTIQVYFSNPIPNLTACLSRVAMGDIRFEPIPHEDYVFWFCILSKIPSESVFKHSIPLAVHTISSSSLSGNKLVVINWWLGCYKRFGYSKLRAVVLLMIRIVLFFVESSIYSLGFGQIDPRSIPYSNPASDR